MSASLVGSEMCIRDSCLAHRASWDRDLPGWMLRPGPILRRGMSDSLGVGACDWGARKVLSELQGKAPGFRNNLEEHVQAMPCSCWRLLSGRGGP
eukprot:15470555-Alexandrium_andersonii.AAC.1